MKTKFKFSGLILTFVHVICVYLMLRVTTIEEQNLYPFSCIIGLISSYLADILCELKELNKKDKE